MTRQARRNTILVATMAFLVLLVVLLVGRKNPDLLAKPLVRDKLTIAISSTYVGSGLPYIAAAKAYFEQEGLDVQLLPYTSGRDALRAVFEQRADLATAANIPIMFSAMQGLPISIVCTIFSASRDHGILARKDSGIGTPADLKGKKIGVTLQSDSHFVLSTMLAQHQLTTDAVKIEKMPPEAMLDALLSGKVDAISAWEPILTSASKALGSNASEFRTQGSFLFDFNLVGRKQWTAANSDRLRRLLRALLKAKQFIAEHPREGRQLIIDSMKMEPDTFQVPGPRYRFVVQLDQNLLIMLEDQTRWAIQAGLTPNTVMPDYLSSIDMTPLTAAKPDAVTIVR